MSAPLAGKHALVTGGGRGIGAAIATALAAEGARLTLLGRDRTALERHAATLPETAAVKIVFADVADPDDVNTAFNTARARHGEVEILVNNAGIALSRPFAKMGAVAWNSVINTNLGGTYNCTRSAVAPMIAARRGRIVNIASTAGLVGGKYIAAYCASKHGVIGLTRALATELADKGITVNAVCPGFTETSMLDRAVSSIVAGTGRTEEAAAAALLAHNPLGRFVRPEEVAATVVWLCGPGADAITGQAIVVDGGEVQR